jgi:hypothetical protein
MRLTQNTAKLCNNWTIHWLWRKFYVPSPRYRALYIFSTRDRCYDFLNIFAKNRQKLVFSTQNKAKLWKNLIITLVFEKNATLFAENWRKSQKIAIITTTPGKCLLFCAAHCSNGNANVFLMRYLPLMRHSIPARFEPTKKCYNKLIINLLTYNT